MLTFYHCVGGFMDVYDAQMPNFAFKSTQFIRWQSHFRRAVKASGWTKGPQQQTEYKATNKKQFKDIPTKKSRK